MEHFLPECTSWNGARAASNFRLNGKSLAARVICSDFHALKGVPPNPKLASPETSNGIPGHSVDHFRMKGGDFPSQKTFFSQVSNPKSSLRSAVEKKGQESGY